VQWKASIRDRLRFHADHYYTPDCAKALIWASTEEVARRYLQPCYVNKSNTNGFRDYKEMLELLEEYFLTGYKTEDARNEFTAMIMGGKGHPNETFAEFKAQFMDLSVRGEIPKLELFYHMWISLRLSYKNVTARTRSCQGEDLWE
jgi:hypothetical protein